MSWRDPDSDVLIEFHRVGSFMKVSAVDTATRVEVSIVGPPEAGEEALKRIVMRKLAYVLSKKVGAADPKKRGIRV